MVPAYANLIDYIQKYILYGCKATPAYKKNTDREFILFYIIPSQRGINMTKSKWSKAVAAMFLALAFSIMVVACPVEPPDPSASFTSTELEGTWEGVYDTITFNGNDFLAISNDIIIFNVEVGMIGTFTLSDGNAIVMRYTHFSVDGVVWYPRDQFVDEIIKAIIGATNAQWNSMPNVQKQMLREEFEATGYIPSTVTGTFAKAGDRLTITVGGEASIYFRPGTRPTWTPQSNVTTLFSGVWADGNIDSSSGEWFSFTATASTQYVHVSFDTLDDLYVELFDNTGRRVGGLTNLDDSTSYTSQSPTIGQTYYIRVRPYNSGESGTYQIVFNTSSTPSGPNVIIPIDGVITLTEGVWGDGSITTIPGGEQWFSFTATASTQYIHASFGTLTDLYVQLYESTSSAVGSRTSLSNSSSYSGNSHTTSRSLTSGRTYYIRVQSRDSYRSGTYKIAFNKSSTAPEGWTPSASYTPLTEGVWGDGSIAIPGGEEWFSFTATASTQYIHVSFGTLTDLYVQLYESTGSEVGSRTNLYSTRSTSRSLTSGKTYYIRVQPYYSSSRGTYKIVFNTSSTPPEGWTPSASYTPLTEGVWEDGNIAISGGEQWFSFTATASTQYIHASFGTLTDLYVQLYESTGGEVESRTNLYSSTRSTSRSLTSGKTYYIRVQPHYSFHSGTYKIAFNTSSTPP
jgi:hypothetical protein